MDILKQVRDRINNTECVKESSYGMFLRLLGKYYIFIQLHYTEKCINFTNLLQDPFCK